MIYLTGKRRSGKTTTLIYASAVTGYPIVTPTRSMADFIKKQAQTLDIKIPEPVCVEQLRLFSRGRTDDNDKYFIDNADEIIKLALKEYLHCTPVAAVINDVTTINALPKEQ